MRVPRSRWLGRPWDRETGKGSAGEIFLGGTVDENGYFERALKAKMMEMGEAKAMDGTGKLKGGDGR